MSFQSDIFAAATDDETLSELIGTRFFWDIADGSAAAPYIVAQTISGSGETAHDGSRDVAFPLIQFTAWGPSKTEVIAVMSALRSTIEGRNLPGASNVSLGYAGEHSSYDSETKFYGEILEYRASSNTN